LAQGNPKPYIYAADYFLVRGDIQKAADLVDQGTALLRPNDDFLRKEAEIIKNKIAQLPK
jgi:hypothetical protein